MTIKPTCEEDRENEASKGNEPIQGEARGMVTWSYQAADRGHTQEGKEMTDDAVCKGQWHSTVNSEPHHKNA